MEISFAGHSPETRSVDLDSKDVETVAVAIREAFRNHIEFGRFKDPYGDSDRAIVKLCKKYGVDVEYTPDRMAFLTAVLARITIQ